MFIHTCRARLPLTVGRFARLQKAQSTRLTVLRGSAWITIDNDLRDIVLEPGESFVVDTDARVLIYPLRSGQALEIVIDDPVVRPSPRLDGAAWWSLLRRKLAPALPASLGVALP